MEVKSKSKSETKKAGQKLAKNLQSGDVVALYGDLGAGKTIFAQGVASGLSVKRKVTSPTYIFMRSYPIYKNNQNLTLYHIDLYRAENQSDLESLGLSEIFSPDSIILMEWAEKIHKALPKRRYDVKIEKTGPKTRKISINFRK